MKNNYSLFISILFISIQIKAQNCPFDNTFFTDMTPSSVGDVITESCLWAGNYVTVDVVIGEAYSFETCVSNIDTTLTLYDATGTTILASDDDGCGSPGGPAIINWTATFTGTVNVLLDEFPCDHSSTCINLNVTWVDTLGIGDPTFNQDISIYPNPTKDIINIGFKNQHNDISIKVFNVKGQLVYSKENINVSSYKINLKNSPQGLLFIEIQSKNKRAFHKIIKK